MLGVSSVKKITSQALNAEYYIERSTSELYFTSKECLNFEWQGGKGGNGPSVNLLAEVVHSSIRLS